VSVKIRLTRMGTKKRPYYRVVAMDSRKKRDGAYLDNLGMYHPLETGEGEVALNEEKIRKWIGKGARPSHTVKVLMNKKGIQLK